MTTGTEFAEQRTTNSDLNKMLESDNITLRIDHGPVGDTLPPPPPPPPPPPWGFYETLIF